LRYVPDSPIIVDMKKAHENLKKAKEERDNAKTDNQKRIASGKFNQASEDCKRKLDELKSVGLSFNFETGEVYKKIR